MVTATPSIIILTDMAKVKYSKQNSNDTEKFVRQLSKIMRRNNGTPEGLAALAESLKRSGIPCKEMEAVNV